MQFYGSSITEKIVFSIDCCRKCFCLFKSVSIWEDSKKWMAHWWKVSEKSEQWLCFSLTGNCQSVWLLCRNVFTIKLVTHTSWENVALLKKYEWTEQAKDQSSKYKRRLIRSTKTSYFSSDVHNSVTRLDDFWKFLVTKCSTKVAQMLGNYLGYFEKQLNLSKKCWGYILSAFEKFLATFYSNIWSHTLVS